MKRTTITKCPKCGSRKFVISIFGSICSDCFYEEKGGKFEEKKNIAEIKNMPHSKNQEVCTVEGWREKLEKFVKKYTDNNGYFCMVDGYILLEQFISEELERKDKEFERYKEILQEEIAIGITEAKQEAFNLPMGVSHWKQHGITHKYWDYFKQEAKKEVRKKIIEKVVGLIGNAKQFEKFSKQKFLEHLLTLLKND